METRGLNGTGYPMDDYGAVSDRQSEDKIQILDRDDMGSPDSDGIEFKAPVYHNKECYFSDGLRQIDFILVYEESLESKRGSQEDSKKVQWRNKFMKNLRKAGLQSEEEMLESGKKLITFVKLHAPWDVCCLHAEDLCLRAPLQMVGWKGLSQTSATTAHSNPSSNFTAKVLTTLHIPNVMQQQVPNTPLDYYTCQFKTSKLNRFLGSEDQENFFPPVQRHRIVNQILSTAAYGKRKKAEIGIERLTEEGVYSAAFPLHDVSGHVMFPPAPSVA